MYNPKEYWNNREKPTIEDEIQPFEKEFLEPLVEDANSVFEIGPGVGRLAPLFSGKHYGYKDITDRYQKKLKDELFKNSVNIKEQQFYDLGVAVKVFLHIPPEQIKKELEEMAKKCNIVAVVDISTDEKLNGHNFSHNYKSLLKGRIMNYNKIGNQITFIYQ